MKFNVETSMMQFFTISIFRFRMISLRLKSYQRKMMTRIRYIFVHVRLIITSSYTKNVFFQLKKHISFSVVRARHDDKFVTRLTFVTRIVWFTELDDKNIAFSFLWNSFSYMRKDSSKEIWAKNEAIDRDVWRSRFADV